MSLFWKLGTGSNVSENGSVNNKIFKKILRHIFNKISRESVKS